MNKHLALLLGLGILLSACGGNSNQTTDQASEKAPAPAVSDKGIGEIKSVTMNSPLKPDMVAKGQAIYDMKCAACHKLDEMRVVGPGWKGLTERRKPEWIMNMITNVEVMLDKDPAAQALLEECLTRMPNQNVSVGDARDILEFMYSIDEKK
ncbi:MAG: cytochrome c [Haliscomenobacter sp.]|uniref:c-type cytochrome n=1 Tax=Haliscomenobacter sp. TaxID=2717303 RepID=UPI0029B12D4C|nr:cytochrome c [Haliscomenobacter sp.]MDX2067594.1 cytochrome c [Haliscomenobacter sp.]